MLHLLAYGLQVGEGQQIPRRFGAQERHQKLAMMRGQSTWQLFYEATLDLPAQSKR